MFTFQLFGKPGVWDCFRYRFPHTNCLCFFTFILLQPLLLLLLPLVEAEGLLHGQEEISPLLTTFLPQALLFMDEVIIKRLRDVLRDRSNTKLFLTLDQFCLLFGFLWILGERLPLSLWCRIRSSRSWWLDSTWGKILQNQLWAENKSGRCTFHAKHRYHNYIDINYLRCLRFSEFRPSWPLMLCCSISVLSIHSVLLVSSEFCRTLFSSPVWCWSSKFSRYCLRLAFRASKWTSRDSSDFFLSSLKDSRLSEACTLTPSSDLEKSKVGEIWMDNRYLVC